MASPPGARPRVCVITSVHPPLDARIFHREAKSMAAAGFDVLLIAPGAPSGPVDGVRFASLPAWGGRAARPFRWPVAFWKAWRAHADLYHLHDPELLPWGLLLRWVTRKPVVYDSHEYLKEDILTKLWIPARLRPLAAAAADRLQNTVCRRLSAVVAVTDEMAGRFRAVQPRTITIKSLPPTPVLPEPLPERAPIVAHAGLMSAERGLRILHETARLVRQQVPEAEFHILGLLSWAGMPTGAERQPPAYWEDAGVRFLGQAPQPDVAPFLARAMVGWLPRDPDVPNNLLAWPNKLGEYMIVGLPVVASDLPLQAALIAEANCGRVVEGLVPAAHAEAIVALLRDPALARELGENGRRAAERNFTWEAEAAKLQTLYTELTAPRPKTR